MIIIAIELKDLSLRDIVPQNLLTDENVQGLIYALDPELNAITRDIPQSAVLASIDNLDEKVLDLLAWQFHADFYDLATTLPMKREAVRNSILFHMRKGTPWAIKEALRQIDVSAEVVPWYEMDPPGEPYTFALHTIISGEYYRDVGREVLMQNIRRAVNEAKSARSLLTYLSTEIHDTQEQELYAGVFPYLYGNIIIHPKPPEVEAQGNIYTGLAHALNGEIYIGLEREKQHEYYIYAAQVISSSVNIQIGVDLDIMHELLLLFENRIYSRLDDFMAQVMDKISDITSEIQPSLKWADDDE